MMRTVSWNDVQARVVSGRDFCLEPLGVPELSGAMLVNAAAEAGFRFVSIFAHAPTPEMQIDEVVADVVNNAVRRIAGTKRSPISMRHYGMRCWR